MELRIDRNFINKQNPFDLLHDCVVSEVIIKANCVELNILGASSGDEAKYQMIVSLGKNTLEFINVYLYKINNGMLEGRISDIESIIRDGVSFEIIDIGYMNSIVFIKGSIIKNGKLDRDNILIEFCFEDVDSYLEIKKTMLSHD